MNRPPPPREINRRLNEAKLALEENKAYFSNPAKAVEELTALNIGDSGEVFVLILKLLDEVKVENYAGHPPPQVNYEPQGKGLELWAFTWKSSLLKKSMYLKFSVKNGCFYYVSLHESKFH